MSQNNESYRNFTFPEGNVLNNSQTINKKCFLMIITNFCSIRCRNDLCFEKTLNKDDKDAWISFKEVVIHVKDVKYKLTL